MSGRLGHDSDPNFEEALAGWSVAHPDCLSDREFEQLDFSSRPDPGRRLSSSCHV